MKKSVIVRYIVLFSLAAIAVIVLLRISSHSKSQAYTTPAPAIEVSKPVLRTISQSIELNGYIEADAMIPVVPLVSGIITDYPVKAGSIVKKGELIAKIDEASYMQQMLQAQAAYLGYESTFERIQGLYNSNATTKQNYESSKAQRDAAKAQYELAELQLSYTSVNSPVAGTVLSAPSAVGCVGTNTQPVAVIADLTKLVVRIDVDEKYFDIFNSNQKKLSAQIVKPASEGFSVEKRCNARLDSIAPYIQAQSKTFKAVFNLTGDISDFKPGMYVKLEVDYRTEKDIFALPLGTLKVDGSCYIYDAKTNSAKWIKFPIEIKDETWFKVPDGYKDNEFVTSGQNTLFDGQIAGKVVSVPADSFLN